MVLYEKIAGELTRARHGMVDKSAWTKWWRALATVTRQAVEKEKRKKRKKKGRKKER